MSKVFLLSPEISQKIAAGEVIERPFSVVKELVENSLDARADDIKVEVLEGGKQLIRVTDNGFGMTREDALLSFERYSTSKIHKENDLNNISTLGFRGEALPSISSVSHVILKTREKKNKKGTLIERQGEELIRVCDVGFPGGTGIEVRDLFFNMPARKKFLRSEKSEFSQIVKYLIQVALAGPGVRVALYHGTREVFNYPRSSLLKERIFQIYGKSILEKLMEIDYEEEERRLHGFASRPPLGKGSRSRQLFFVNKRPVKDKVLLGALNRAYRDFLEKDNFPEAFLFLDIPFSEVDVNVHPAKAEVRFNDSRQIFQLLQRGIEKAIIKNMGVKEVYASAPQKPSNFRIEEKGDRTAFNDIHERKVETEQLFSNLKKEKNTLPRVLGQYMNLYIVAVDEEGILIIDQHNAHERVLFEQYEAIDSEQKWPRKLALFPILIELSPSQVISLEQNKKLLEDVGFRVEEMGGHSFALKEYPDIFRENEAKDALLSLLEEMKEEKLEMKKKKLLSTMACKTAIKAGEVLSSEKMIYLVEKLFSTSNPSICPHGRPVILRISRYEIEKGIKRH